MKFSIRISRMAAVLILAVTVIINPVLASPPPRVHTPVSRPHTAKEVALDYSFVYVVLWASYFVAQPNNAHKLSWEHFATNNFEKGVVFWDNNRFTTNFVGHPYAGSEYYLYFRSRGYGPPMAALNSALSSALFEAGVESFHVPISGIDLIVTPLLGVPIGWCRERAGLKLVASDKKYQRFAGFLLYPETYAFWFEDFTINPAIDLETGFMGLSFSARF